MEAKLLKKGLTITDIRGLRSEPIKRLWRLLEESGND